MHVASHAFGQQNLGRGQSDRPLVQEGRLNFDLHVDLVFVLRSRSSVFERCSGFVELSSYVVAETTPHHAIEVFGRRSGALGI